MISLPRGHSHLPPYFSTSSFLVNSIENNNQPGWGESCHSFLSSTSHPPHRDWLSALLWKSMILKWDTIVLPKNVISLTCSPSFNTGWCASERNEESDQLSDYLLYKRQRLIQCVELNLWSHGTTHAPPIPFASLFFPFFVLGKQYWQQQPTWHSTRLTLFSLFNITPTPSRLALRASIKKSDIKMNYNHLCTECDISHFLTLVQHTVRCLGRGTKSMNNVLSVCSTSASVWYNV